MDSSKSSVVWEWETQINNEPPWPMPPGPLAFALPLFFKAFRQKMNFHVISLKSSHLKTIKLLYVIRILLKINNYLVTKHIRLNSCFSF